MKRLARLGWPAALLALGLTSVIPAPARWVGPAAGMCTPAEPAAIQATLAAPQLPVPDPAGRAAADPNASVQARTDPCTPSSTTSASRPG